MCWVIIFLPAYLILEKLFSNLYNQLTAKIADRFSSYLSLT
ncbi:unnamed protein product, partial [marine sediment metagenome]